MSDYQGAYTTNLNLSKDSEDDFYDVNRVNSNSDKIDYWAGEVNTSLNAITKYVEITMNSVNQTVADSDDTQLLFSTMVANDYVELTSSGALRIKKEGNYLINFSACFINCIGKCEIKLNIKSTMCSLSNNNNISGNSCLYTSRICTLKTNDVVAFVVKQSSGGSINISGSPTVTIAQLHYLGGN